MSDDLFGFLDANVPRLLTPPAGYEGVHREGNSWARQGDRLSNTSWITPAQWNHLIAQFRALATIEGVDLSDVAQSSPLLLREALLRAIAVVLAGEDIGSFGLMEKAVFDPRAINADVFDRANHTGTQDISTITGLQTALDNKQAILDKQISIELGSAVSSSQPIYIDFHTLEGPSDYAARIIRNVGADGSFDISNTGTGPIVLSASGGVTINGGTAWHSGNFTPANYLPLAGGTMTGPISFGSVTGDKLLLYGTNYGMAVLPSEFAMWATSTAAFRWRWNSSAGAVGAELTSAGFKLPTATPTDNLHAASKQYVDANAGGVGVGQTWQNVSGSRAINTAYQNTTGKPIQLSISAAISTDLDFQVSANGSAWLNAQRLDNFGVNHIAHVIPNGWYYRLNAASGLTITYWLELR